MAKSNSLTGVITPVKTPALKRIGQSISVTVHKRLHAPVVMPPGFCRQTFHRSALFTAVHQFSHGGSTSAPSTPASPHKGLVISTSTQQPVLERHCGESRSHREGDQASRGEGGATGLFACAVFKTRPSAGIMQRMLRLCGSPCEAEVYSLPTLCFCEAGLHRAYERGCELAVAQLPLLNNQL